MVWWTAKQYRIKYRFSATHKEARDKRRVSSGLRQQTAAAAATCFLYVFTMESTRMHSIRTPDGDTGTEDGWIIMDCTDTSSVETVRQ